MKRKGRFKKRPSMPNGAPKAYPFVSPRFEVDDVDGYKYLEEHGYVVFKNVLTPEEVEIGRGLAWDFLEGIPNSSIKRNDPTSWSEGWPDPFGAGIIVQNGAGHSQFLWYTRGIPKVQKIYQTIWNTPDLITSFDGFCVHRPFEYNEEWKTKEGWYHLDQNGCSKPEKVCIQGFVNYYDADENDGGLVVVPDSLKIFNEIFKNRPAYASLNDFIKLADKGPNCVWQNEVKTANIQPIKVCAKAGDMVLWDSRTIHCNAPATEPRPLPRDGSALAPRRVVAYVCMTPSSRLTPDIIYARQQAYSRGHTTSHWPEDCSVSGRTNRDPRYTPPKLSPSQRALIPLYDDDDDDGDGDDTKEKETEN